MVQKGKPPLDIGSVQKRLSNLWGLLTDGIQGSLWYLHLYHFSKMLVGSQSRSANSPARATYSRSPSRSVDRNIPALYRVLGSRRPYILYTYNIWTHPQRDSGYPVEALVVPARCAFDTNNHLAIHDPAVKGHLPNKSAAIPASSFSTPPY